MQPVKFSLTAAPTGKKLGKPSGVIAGAGKRPLLSSVVKPSVLLGQHEEPSGASLIGKREVITHVEDCSIVTTESANKPAALVIPLIDEGEVEGDADGENQGMVEGSSSLVAVTSVEQDSAKQQYSTSSYGLQIMKGSRLEAASATTKISTKKPLLMMRRRHGESGKLMISEEEQLKMDLQYRPDAAPIEAYDKVPIEEFGAALLRGMGWKDGEAVGRSKKNGLLQPVELKRRPDKLGLGAKPPDFIPLPPHKKKRTS